MAPTPIGSSSLADAEANCRQQQAKTSLTTDYPTGSAAEGFNQPPPSGGRTGGVAGEKLKQAKQSARAGLTQGNRPPRSPMRFKGPLVTEPSRAPEKRECRHSMVPTPAEAPLLSHYSGKQCSNDQQTCNRRKD